ncbi:hypothetical protein Ddc_24357 [Ditylenchus destructor]|nr:hypothetical protein Ddc_24357 [Ditylenchus destructor]
MALAAPGTAHAQHAKLDGPLSDLVDQQQVRRTARLAVATDVMRADQSAMTDDQGRILVDLYVQKGASLQSVKDARGRVRRQHPGGQRGLRRRRDLGLRPASSLLELWGNGGLNVITMTQQPQRNVGITTSQGTAVLRSNVANASGWTGAGIPVGVLSDSYDGSPSTFSAVRAANDIASGDLRPPKFVIDLAPASNLTDEGRAMMQIVQDVAPQADQCFATAFAGAASFAANIRTLRTNPPGRAADVIVDDVFYFDEPFFSDGGRSRRRSTTSPPAPRWRGKPVSYFSSGARNQGSAGGLRRLPELRRYRLQRGGGFLDFGGGVYALPVTYNASGSRLLVQWDDLFYRGKVTTDLNFYLINSAGNCVFRYANNNLSVDNALESVSLSGGAWGNYRIMIARTSAGTKQASRVRIANRGGWGGGALSQVRNSPTTFGHSASANANSVAAYRYTYTAGPSHPRAIGALQHPRAPGDHRLRRGGQSPGRARDAQEARLRGAGRRQHPPSSIRARITRVTASPTSSAPAQPRRMPRRWRPSCCRRLAAPARDAPKQV